MTPLDVARCWVPRSLRLCKGRVHALREMQAEDATVDPSPRMQKAQGAGKAFDTHVESTIQEGRGKQMTDDVTKQTGCSDLGKSVSSPRIEVRDSQEFAKPAHLQQPDVIPIPPPAPQGEGNSQAAVSQSSSNTSSKGE